MSMTKLGQRNRRGLGLQDPPNVRLRFTTPEGVGAMADGNGGGCAPCYAYSPFKINHLYEQRLPFMAVLKGKPDVFDMTFPSAFTAIEAIGWRGSGDPLLMALAG